MKMSTLTKALCAVVPVLGAAGALLFAGGCSSTGEPTSTEAVLETEEALSAEQCNYFAVDGKVQICHRTGSTTKPYTILKVSEAACVSAHALHAGDYVAVGDPTCQGGGCLPENAPCDATLPCCDGSSCTAGICTKNVSDNCSPSPCENGSTCENTAGGYACTCVPGYVGTDCETEIDECASNPCVYGQCLDGINSYICQCTPGWTGEYCDIEIDECESNPCVNGQCVDQVNMYECQCEPGWTGTNCDINIDECASNPCVNGQCVDGLADYSCTCNSGWTGTNCDINIDECAAEPCMNAGTCIDGINSYTCQCPSGWTGTNCEEAVVTCPCLAYPDWYDPAYYTNYYACGYGDPTAPTGDFMNLYGDFANIWAILDPGGAGRCLSGFAPNGGQLDISVAEGQACLDYLRALDTATYNLCAPCISLPLTCPGQVCNSYGPASTADCW